MNHYFYDYVSVFLTLRNLHNYLVWQVVRNYVGFLSQDFREAAKVLEKAQMGVDGTEETWRECIVATDAALGPAVGAMYVRKAFHGDSKEMVYICDSYCHTLMPVF